jgi:hypothetical protein
VLARARIEVRFGAAHVVERDVSIGAVLDVVHRIGAVYPPSAI